MQICSFVEGFTFRMSVEHFPPGQYLTLHSKQFGFMTKFTSYYNYAWNDNKLLKK